MSSETVSLLTRYPLFVDLTDEELRLVARIVTVRDIEAGTTIISENETGDELYLLEDGVVDIQKTLTVMMSRSELGTKERSFVRLTGTDRCFFGEMVLFGTKERSATVRAVTRCKVFVIRDSDFLALCETNPRIGYVVLSTIARIISEHLRRANNDILKLTTALSLAFSG